MPVTTLRVALVLVLMAVLVTASVLVIRHDSGPDCSEGGALVRAACSRS